MIEWNTDIKQWSVGYCTFAKQPSSVLSQLLKSSNRVRYKRVMKPITRPKPTVWNSCSQYHVCIRIRSTFTERQTYDVSAQEALKQQSPTQCLPNQQYLTFKRRLKTFIFYNSYRIPIPTPFLAHWEAINYYRMVTQLNKLQLTIAKALQ